MHRRLEGGGLPRKLPLEDSPKLEIFYRISVQKRVLSPRLDFPEYTTVSEERTHFCGKLSEFCERFGEFVLGTNNNRLTRTC